MPQPLQSFQGANIQGGDFRAFSGDFNQHISVGSGFQALSQLISHGAMHDAAERDPPPRCHPGTREKALEDIVRWIEEPNPSTSVLWVNGRAGVGKTALTQSIAERGGVYFGGCFFFRRGVSGCNQKEFLFSTLAYQLATNVPGFLEHIDGAMSRDFALPRKSAAIQLQRLIVEPIRLLPVLPHALVILIDGLDECDGLESQCDLLSLVSQVAMDPSLPIRFVIASRPEHQICSMFIEEPLSSMTRRLILDEEYDSASDIKQYLQDKFAEIHRRNKDIMRQVRNPWPSEYDLESLVTRSSGQFIYASTAIKFIGSATDFLSPEQKLEIILIPGPMTASAFSDLDRLYTQILSTYDPKVLVGILRVILALEHLNMGYFQDLFIGPEIIADMAGLGEVEVNWGLRALQSLTKISSEPIYDDENDEPSGIAYQRVQLSHRSFYDFLTDRERSGTYFIDTNRSVGEIFCRIFELAAISAQNFSSGSLSKTNLETWLQLEIIIERQQVSKLAWSAQDRIKKSELSHLVNTLRGILFNDETMSSKHSFEFLAALIPMLNCLCSALYLIQNLKPFTIFLDHDPLQLSKFYHDTCDILDECYRQFLSGLAIGLVTITMHIALDFETYRNFLPASRICNIPNLQLASVKKFLREHFFLFKFRAQPWSNRFDNGRIEGYFAPVQLRNFYLDPGRSQHLYPTPVIIGKCWKVIQYTLGEKSAHHWAHDHTYNYMMLASALEGFFIPKQGCQLPSATHMLSAGSIRNEPHDVSLLRFLGHLCRMPWLDICIGTKYTRAENKDCTLVIARWVCMALESSSMLQWDGNIQDALHKIFIEIILRGIVPALRVKNFWFKKTGILEIEGASAQCLECLWKHILLERSRYATSFEFNMVVEVLAACTSRDCFSLFCTTVVEAFLFQTIATVIGSFALNHSHTCIENSNPSNEVEVKPFPKMHDKMYVDYGSRRGWGFAFCHASRSSESILGALRWLCLYWRDPPFVWPVPRFVWPATVSWIVSEMIDWLKTQTADPHPQDELITWMEGAYTEVERAIAKQKDREMKETAGMMPVERPE